MKNNKKKTNHSSSFGRLWSYLQAYRFPLYLAIFLKIVSVIMSVIEPVVIGLAITELTKNTLDIIKGVEGAHINVSYVGLVLKTGISNRTTMQFLPLGYYISVSYTHLDVYKRQVWGLAPIPPAAQF